MIAAENVWKIKIKFSQKPWSVEWSVLLGFQHIITILII